MKTLSVWAYAGTEASVPEGTRQLCEAEGARVLDQRFMEQHRAWVFLIEGEVQFGGERWRLLEAATKLVMYEQARQLPGIIAVPAAEAPRPTYRLMDPAQLLGLVQKVKLEEGDLLICRLPRNIPMREVSRVREQLKTIIREQLKLERAVAIVLQGGDDVFFEIAKRSELSDWMGPIHDRLATLEAMVSPGPHEVQLVSRQLWLQLEGELVQIRKNLTPGARQDLLAAAQSLNRENENLRARNTQLEERLEKLESAVITDQLQKRVDALESRLHDLDGRVP